MKDNMKQWINICTTCAIIFMSTVISYGQKKYSFKVSVNYEEAKKGDTLCLYKIGPYDLSLSDKNPEFKLKASLNKEGYFDFHVSSPEKVGYYAIGLLHAPEWPFAKGSAIGLAKTLVPEKIYEAGDEVLITIKTKDDQPSYETFDPNLLYNYSFAGKGSRKFWLTDKLDSFCGKLDRTPLYLDLATNQVMIDQSIIKEIEGFIEKNSDGISPNSKAMILIDALSGLSSVSLSGIQVVYNRKKDSAQAEAIKKIKTSFAAIIKDTFEVSPQPDIILYAYSNAFIRFMVKRLQVESLMNTGHKDVSYVFDKIISGYAGELREKMATLTLYSSFGSKDFERQLNQLLNIAKKEESRKILLQFQLRKVGESIPNFILEDLRGKSISTSQFKGKVIIMDFWFTGCGACMWTFENVISKVENDFRENDKVIFLSISVDQSRMRWQSGVDSGRYTSDDAVNLYTMGKGAAHPLIDRFNIRGYPTLIVIDQGGKVASFNDQSFREGPVALREMINELINNH